MAVCGVISGREKSVIKIEFLICTRVAFHMEIQSEGGVSSSICTRVTFHLEIQSEGEVSSSILQNEDQGEVVLLKRNNFLV